MCADRFRFDGILGRGGMATVIAAHDTNLDREVAIKTLHVHLDREEAVARFLREAQIMARLTSEHTVRIHELGQHADGTPYIVMERVVGRGLHDLVTARGPLPVEEALAYTRQVCVALAEAHACGIIHRDVKPSNIVIDEGRRRVKVVDFGIAKVPESEEHSGLTSTRALLGTPEYMAPEQMYAAHDVDGRADLWGLGATLYFMLTGEPPFDAPELAQLLDAIRHAPLPSLRARRPDVPAHVDAAVQRCLHRDPRGRYRSAIELAQQLAPIPSLALDDDPCLEPTAVTESSEEVTKLMPASSLLRAPAPLRPGAAARVNAVFPRAPRA